MKTCSTSRIPSALRPALAAIVLACVAHVPLAVASHHGSQRGNAPEEANSPEDARTAIAENAIAATADSGESAGNREASTRVEAFHDVLLQAMQLDGGYSERVAVLAPAVQSLFDIDAIARVTLGRTWRNLDVDQQRTFAQKLERLIVSTYSDRFDAYNDQTFEVRSVQPVKRGSTVNRVVKSVLTRRDGSVVTLDYYFRGSGVFNVVADGVSDLSLRRADYNSIIKSEGYDALLVYMDEQIEQHALRNPSADT